MNVAFCVVFVFISVYLAEHLIKHGEPIRRKYNFWAALLNAAIELTLFLWVAHWIIR